MAGSTQIIPPAESLRQLASMFCRPVFAGLAKGNVADGILAAKRYLYGRSTVRVATVLERAYAEMHSNYRTEYVYKNELASKILFARHTPTEASLVSEMRTGASILDVAIFNGTSSAYEIKTEYDNFSRLSEQLSDYSRVFDKIFVVTHPAAARAALDAAPSHVGIAVLNAKGALSLRREALSNRQSVDAASVFNTLRQSEYLNILRRTHYWDGNAPRGLLFQNAKALFCELPPEVAHDEAVREWRTRTTDESHASFVASLPSSLRALGVSEPLSGIGRERLKATLGATI